MQGAECRVRRAEVPGESQHTVSRRRKPRDDKAQREVAKRPAEPVSQPEPSRRTFLWKAWLGLAVIALAEIVWVIVDFLKPRRAPAGEDEAVVVAGPVDQFALNSVTAFPEGSFYLVLLGSGGFLAVSRECTHLGCTVPWIDDEHRFVCPCHSSSFDIRGDVIKAPAPRALDLYEVRIENRIVKVNTANLRRRRVYEANQVTYA